MIKYLRYICFDYKILGVAWQTIGAKIEVPDIN